MFYASAVVPQNVLEQLNDLRTRRSQICPLECIALEAAYFHPELEAYFKSRNVIHFADNTAANGAVINAYSSAPDLARIVYTYTLRTASLSTRVWVEYVPSAANIADGPSRPDDENTLNI